MSTTNSTQNNPNNKGGEQVDTNTTPTTDKDEPELPEAELPEEKKTETRLLDDSSLLDIHPPPTKKFASLVGEDVAVGNEEYIKRKEGRMQLYLTLSY